ncbi:MAG: NAD(P)H-dependent oxidoreductase subunit E [Methylomicrobium sp.]
MSYFKHHIFFCTNQRENGAACCQDYDAQRFRDYAKDRLKQLKMTGPGQCRVSNAGCLDRCKDGPVLVVYPDAVWYRYADRTDIDQIIEEHLQNGRIVERLQV